MAPKLSSYYKIFSKIIGKACVQILRPVEPRFNTDHVHVIKVLGGNLDASQLISGYVIPRGPESDIVNKLEKVKIACFNCPFDPQGGETKGTILITKAEELLKFAGTEEE